MNAYQVYELRTGLTVGTFKSREVARRKADRLDLEYGAIGYGVRLADSEVSHLLSNSDADYRDRD